MFEQLKDKVILLFKKIEFKQEKIVFIPISGFVGDNLSQRSLKTPWFKGPTLAEALDLIEAPAYKTDIPLRVPILHVCKIGGIGTLGVGKVATGTLKHDYLIAIPSLHQTSPSSIEMHH